MNHYIYCYLESVVSWLQTVIAKFPSSLTLIDMATTSDS